nr:sterol regulatory element-binding protein cleavage-activating protein-like [Cherax quadricarinatus]
MVALYNCICSRNYAEWRASWWGQDGAKDETSQIIGDALPLVLAGHPHDVECMCTNGVLLVSSCLAGIIRVWDPSTGECVANINRRSGKKPEFRMGSPDLADDFHSDYESGSPRSQAGDCNFFRKNASGVWLDEDEKDDSDSEAVDHLDSTCMLKDTSGNHFHTFPDLSPGIDLHFCTRTAESNNSGYFSRFDKYYEEHKKMLQDDEEYRQSRVRKTSDCNEYSSSGSVTKNMMIRSPSYTETSSGYKSNKHCRNLSTGSIPAGALLGYNGGALKGSLEMEGEKTVEEELPPIWCLECQDALVIVGCGSGRIEVWDLYNNVLKCMYDEGIKAGVTSMCMSGNRLMVARLNGAVDMLKIEPVGSCQQTSDAQQIFKPGNESSY